MRVACDLTRIAVDHLVADDEAAEIDPTVTGAIVMVTTNGLLGHPRDLVRRLFRQVDGLILLAASTVLICDHDTVRLIGDAVEFARRTDADRPIDVQLSNAVGSGVVDRLERWTTSWRIRRLPASGNLEAL